MIYAFKILLIINGLQNIHNPAFIKSVNFFSRFFGKVSILLVDETENCLLNQEKILALDYSSFFIKSTTIGRWSLNPPR